MAVLMPTLTCRFCKVEDFPTLRWIRWGNDSLRLGAHCSRCKRMIKWVPRAEPWLSNAPAKPIQTPSVAELDAMWTRG